jgi:hypothetical protein
MGRGRCNSTGTIAGTISESFESNSFLEFYSADLGTPGYDMALLGSIEVKDCFHKVPRLLAPSLWVVWLRSIGVWVHLLVIHDSRFSFLSQNTHAFSAFLGAQGHC